jgi:tRNA(Ile2) C34 agmatinyltransferase TiaS
LYLEDYLYYFNKAISEYMKTRYEVFETNQQLADDMRSWKHPLRDSHQQYIQKYTGHSSEDRRIHTFLSCIIDVAISRPITKCDQRPEQLLPIKSLECRLK